MMLKGRAVLILRLSSALLAVGLLSCRKNHPPDVPPTPGGPASVIVSDYGQYVTSTTDPDGDDLGYQFDWGDGTQSAWSALVHSGEPVTMPKSWPTQSTFSVRSRARDRKEATSEWSPEFRVTTLPNYPPLMPDMLGPQVGYVSITYTYSLLTTDPNGDSVSYQVDWGDGVTSGWSGFAAGGGTVTMTKAWSTPRNYYGVKVRAKDRREAVSSWSPENPVVIMPNDPPDTPYVPSGPDSGYVGRKYAFSVSTFDPDGDSVSYQFNWGRGAGDSSAWGQLKPGGSTYRDSNAWTSAGTYTVKARARDSKGALSAWSAPCAVVVCASPPNPPSAPSGPSSGEVDSVYSFSSSATHPSGDSVAIRFAWGGGDTSNWSAFAPSGQSSTANHAWYDTGHYYVTAQAKNTKGSVSVWSSSHAVAVTGRARLRWRCSTGYGTVGAPAVAADGTIYVGDWDQRLYAISPGGSYRWSYLTDGNVESSPAVGSDGTVYFGSCDSFLYALTSSGSYKWRYRTGFYVRSTPAIGSDGTIYVGSDDEYLYAISASGTRKWRCAVGCWLETSPVVGTDGTIYVQADNDTLFALNPDGSVHWRRYLGGWGRASPAIGSDGTIYTSIGYYLYALNPDSTTQWTYYTGNWGSSSSPAIGTDGTIYIGAADSCLDAVNPDGTRRWRLSTGDHVGSSPAIASDGVIYVGSDDGYLYAVNPDGTIKWRYQAGGDITSPAIGSDGTVYFGSDNDYLYAVWGSGPLANSAWPKFHHDNKNTGRVGGGR